MVSVNESKDPAQFDKQTAVLCIDDAVKKEGDDDVFVAAGPVNDSCPGTENIPQPHIVDSTSISSDFTSVPASNFTTQSCFDDAAKPTATPIEQHDATASTSQAQQCSPTGQSSSSQSADAGHKPKEESTAFSWLGELIQSQNFYDDLMSFLATHPFNIDSYEISFVSSLASRCNISALDEFRTVQNLREWFSRSNILNRAYTSEKEIFLRQVVMCIDQDA